MNIARLLFVSILMVHMGAVAESESKKSYSNEILIAARVRWLGQENRIGQLKFEAKNYAPKGILMYISGGDFVATFDAISQKVVTHVTKEKDVDLSYSEFNELIKNEELYEKALAQYKQEQETPKGLKK